MSRGGGGPILQPGPAAKGKPLSHCPCGHPKCVAIEEAVDGGGEYEMPAEC